MVHHGFCPPAARENMGIVQSTSDNSIWFAPHLKLFAILLSGNVDANVAEIAFFQIQNCVIREY